jgi:hypothetical protein
MFCPVIKNDCDQSCAFHVSQQQGGEVHDSTCVIANAAHNIAEFPHWEIDPEELGEFVGEVSAFFRQVNRRKYVDFYVGVDNE